MTSECQKKIRLLAALTKGMVMIHLDARRPGVVVPSRLRSEPHLRLNLSYRFDLAELKVSDWGIQSTLSFGRHRCKVAVPWSAMFAITSHATRDFWVYPEDVPVEISSQRTCLGVRAYPPLMRAIAGIRSAPADRKQSTGLIRQCHLKLIK